ncbi:amidase [Carnimonas nigrificans]|uniref:amidase n=1 Tax=Carnimonas nigrificans TaxID=64323 RepID=UPI000472DA65|nr:amidase [Carnimonas nigrificans]
MSQWDSAVWAAPALNIEGAAQGPLHSLRVAVKDLFDIAGVATGCGNPDWRRTHEVPTESAAAVKALLAAGATVAGKTHTDELAYSLNGANVHYGTPVNPRAPQRLPGGSSSGSAVAVAMGESEIGLGTDTGGSIRVPASYCGLYGLRPTWGAISLEGAVGLAPGFDTAGLLCPSFELLKRAAQVLLPPQPQHAFKNAIILLPEGVDVPQPLLEGKLEQSGLTCTTLSLSTVTMARASEAFRVLQGRQLWRLHGDWITQTSPRFAADIQKRLAWSSTLDAQQETEAQAQADEVVAWLNELTSDAETLLCLPSTPGASPLLELAPAELAEYREKLMGMTALAGLWGAPALALPWLTQHAAPWGVSLIAPPGNDRSLLELDAQY